MRAFTAGCAMSLLLWFTGADVARADAPRRTAHPTARLGSAVGMTQLGDETVTTLGGELGLGYRIGIFAAEVQLDHASMLEQTGETNSNEWRGTLSRMGLNGRVFTPALSWPGSLEPDSVVRLFGEIGAGSQRGEWASGERFRRTDLTVGGGWLLDHSMHPRTAMPFRSVGWQMGWQLRAARSEEPKGDDAVYLRGTCKDCGPPMPRQEETDLALVVSCSLTASW